MAKLWTTKSSPGKGTGMFATQAIPSGTLILRENGLVLNKNGLHMSYDEEEKHLLRKLSTLDLTTIA